MKRLLFPFCLSALVVALAAVCSADSVTYIGSQGQFVQKSGKILDENYKEVVLETEQDGKQVQESIPTPTVQKVIRSPLPSSYQMGMMRFENQNYAEAAASFIESYKDEKTPDWARWYSAYYTGVANMALADTTGEVRHYESAIKAFDLLLEKWPKSRFAPDARLGKAESLTALGKLDEAKAVFAEIRESDYPESFRLKAQVSAGSLAIAECEKLAPEQKDAALDKVIADMDALAKRIETSKQPEIQEYRYGALLVKAEALLGKRGVKFHREAEDICQMVVLNAKDDQTKAAASNYRGDSLRKRGETREALFSYLRTVVLYFRQKHEYQKALYWASICAARYGLTNRAIELSRELKYRFATSEWAKKLEQDLPAAIQEGTPKGK